MQHSLKRLRGVLTSVDALSKLEACLENIGAWISANVFMLNRENNYRLQEDLWPVIEGSCRRNIQRLLLSYS